MNNQYYNEQFINYLTSCDCDCGLVDIQLLSPSDFGLELNSDNDYICDAYERTENTRGFWIGE